MLRTVTWFQGRTYRPLLILAATAATIFVAMTFSSPPGVGAQEGQLSVDCAGASSQVVSDCQFGEQGTFTVAIHAVSAPAAGYPAFQAKLRWNGAVVSYLPSAELIGESVWPPCAVPARRENAPDDASVLLGCVANPPEASSYTGALLRLEFACIATGVSQISLVPQAGDAQLGSHFVILDEDAPGGQVTVDPTLTGATVTCSDVGEVGDVDCSGEATAIDAALLLQLIAALTDTLPCEQNADVNSDGTVDSIDVALVLQFVAGLLPSLGS